MLTRLLLCCACAGPSTGASALTACEWCPNFFMNTSAGATGITVRARAACAAATSCAD